ncbi:MAG: hypothetical protein ACYS0G_00055 [Planctomycetota bacterium]|jgi:hypothetical protein
MAISHVCLTCGFDLARARVRPEPHYALPVALCPGCGEAAVRRMHPGQRGWRSLLRLKTSLVALILQLSLLLALSGSVTAVCVQTGDAWFRGIIVSEKEMVILVFLAFGLVPISLGVWLSAGLSHTRRLAAWLVFSGLILFLISLDCIGDPVTRRLLDACGMTISLADYRWDLLSARLVVLITIMTVATAGIPLGRLALAAHRQWRRSRWQARRRRLRARRTGR